MALLLPIIFYWPPEVGLVMLSALWMANNYGSSLSSILLGIPGDSGAIMTIEDGHPMAQQGRTASAIGISLAASAAGGIIGALCFLAFAPPLVSLALLFGSAERPGLLGPRPNQVARPLAMTSYGATRWDQAQALLDRLVWAEKWVEKEPGRPLVKERSPRAAMFHGTALEPLFTYVPEHIDEMLRPRFTVYWQFFIDDNFDSHYFGGVGPEIIGTLLITVVGMLFVVPLGVISAAYLVECASEGPVMRILRMSINTLAGVPSIVFGLFGLAFFVLFLFPKLGFEPKACILAASLTLAVLTLPVMIRASEEAIRTVPRSYKEGSLALGASRFRTFVTVTFPAALPGILTGVILSLSRIAGETAPILFTGAVAMGPVPKSIFDPTRTLSYGSYDMAVGDRLAMMVPHNQYGMVLTLIVLILILNAVAIVLRSRVFKKLKGH